MCFILFFCIGIYNVLRGFWRKNREINMVREILSWGYILELGERERRSGREAKKHDGLL